MKRQSWKWVSYGSMEEENSGENGFKDKYASLQLVPVDAELRNGRYRYNDCIIAFYVDHYTESEWKTPNEAQRRLIAKAPEQESIIEELLEALKACADYLGENYVGPIEQARAAITHAEKMTQ